MLSKEPWTVTPDQSVMLAVKLDTPEVPSAMLATILSDLGFPVVRDSNKLVIKTVVKSNWSQ